MPANPPTDTPRISPMIFYRDLPAALDWLAKAFGFETRMSLPDEDGGIAHAEMTLAEGVIMLGPASAERETSSAADLPAVNQSLYVYVDDIDAHFATARAAGATVVSEPVDMFWGDRMYSVKDPESHHWSFAEHVRDVEPGDLVPPS